MFSAYRDRAALHIRDWTLEQKVGQLFILAFPGKDAAVVKPLIERYRLGGCYLSQDNAATFTEARQLTEDLERLNLAAGSRLPMLLGVDQEGAWSVLMPESTTGPGNLALGRADVYPEQRVRVTGLKPEIDALTWLIARATHTVTGSGGFTTALEMETAIA